MIMAPQQDILTEISDESLPKLGEVYRKHVSWAPHVLSLIHTTIKWKKSDEYCDCIRFFSVDNSWQIDGTILVIMQFHSYDIFAFTLDENCTNLHQALTLTNLIDYKNPLAAFFCIHEKHISVIIQVLTTKQMNFSQADHPFFTYVLPPEKCGFLEDCPPDVYVKQLEPGSANQIDSVWPHRFPGSLDYLKILIEMNGGYGVFLKSADEMVSWVVKDCFGNIGMLQTEEGYVRKGYGKLVTQVLAKEIVEEGNRPFACIYAENRGSIAMFEKLGFEKTGTCAYISVNH